MNYLTGLDRLVDAWPSRLQGARIGLLAHPASVDHRGRPSELVVSRAGVGRLVALFGPEHGYFGWGGAGEEILDGNHPSLGIPVRSLYGAHRKPSPEMLADLDVILFDLQDLAVRCYTFVSTLRLVLEAAALAGKTVVVADRSIPLPNTFDGPMLHPSQESFVGLVPAPFVYGLTPAESARWLKAEFKLDVDLRVIPMTGYERRPAHTQHGPPWIPPSPGIRSWWCAYAYAATVFAEAFPTLDVDRAGTLPFQFIGGSSVDGPGLAETMNRKKLPGVSFVPEWRRRDGGIIAGVRLVMDDLAAFRPVEVSLHLVEALQGQLGAGLWSSGGARPDWFDKLYGTESVREALQAGRPAAGIVHDWMPGLVRFAQETAPHRLYPAFGELV